MGGTLAEAMARAQESRFRLWPVLRWRQKRRTPRALNKCAERGNPCIDPPAGSPPIAHDQISAAFHRTLPVGCTAFVLFVYDGTKSIANQHPLTPGLAKFGPGRSGHLNLAQNWLKQKSPGPGIPTFRSPIDLPAWASWPSSR